MDKKHTISACLVVYNEESVIERCLESIVGLVDEIIVVHDGPCTDRTLEIAKKFTDKVFVRKHVGIMEAHLVFAFKHAAGDWLLRIDADEFFDKKDLVSIKKEIQNDNIDALALPWEMWNGQRAITFKGLKKVCFFRKEKFHYCGVPHEAGYVDGVVKYLDIFLHHRPRYNNISWSSFLKKKKKWIPIHVQYFFYDISVIDCFNINAEFYDLKIKKVRKNVLLYMLFEPPKVLIGQLRNGLCLSWYGWNMAFQQFFYQASLYYGIWKIQKKLK